MTSRIGQAPHNIIGMFVNYCDTVSRAMATSVNKAFRKAFDDPDKLRAALYARGFPTSETNSVVLKKTLCLTEIDYNEIFNSWLINLFTKDSLLGVLPLPNIDSKSKLSAMAIIHLAEKAIKDLKSNKAAYEAGHLDASERYQNLVRRRRVGGRRRIVPIPHDDIQKQDPEFAKYVSDAAQLMCLTDVNRHYQYFLNIINSTSIQSLIRDHGIKAPKPKIVGRIKLEDAKDASVEPPKRDLRPERIEDVFGIDQPRRRAPVQRTIRREPPQVETNVRFFSMPKTVWGKLGLAGVLFNTIPVLASGILQWNTTKIFSTTILAGAAVYAFNRLENPSGASFIRTFAADAFYMMTCRCGRTNKNR